MTPYLGPHDRRDYAEWLDKQDPIAPMRDLFFEAAPGVIYLDGNSLGQLPHRTIARQDRILRDEWGRGLIGSWGKWIDQPFAVGDLIAEALLGARSGEVVVSDSTSVNLFKLVTAALAARPDRRVIVTDSDNFPTDRYVLEGIAARSGATVRYVPSDIDEGMDPDLLRAHVDHDTAVVCLSHVAYRSGALSDMAAINEIAHGVGALVCWDLSHSVGAVPITLEETGSDLAVGCTYKYLNAGPGAPAFLYVRTELQGELRQPIWGWFSQEDQFAMDQPYQPRDDIGRFLVGTPPILGIAAVEEGVKILAEAGIERLRAKGMALTDFLIELADVWLVPHGFSLASPRNARRRGSHVSLRHDDADRISRALIELVQVVPDYRPPARLRLGPAPITTRFVDVFDGLERIRELVAAERHLAIDLEPHGKTQAASART